MDEVHCNNCGADNKLNAKYCSQCGYELPRNTADIDTKSKDITQKSKKSGNKFIVAIVSMLAFGLAYIAVQQIFFKTPTTDKVLVATASVVNKSCPMMVDAQTRLDNAIALPDNIFQYNYTLINLEKSQVNVDTLKKYVEPVIINGVRTSPDLKFFRDKKTTMVYNYRDKNGVFIHKLSVTPDMYKE